MAYQSPLITVMARAASRAALALIRDYNEADNLLASVNGADGLVEASARRAGETLRRELARARPGFTFDGTGGGSRWIVRPLDGRANFVHAIPHACIAIAAATNDEIVAGVVLDPLRDELFWAGKGQGAFMRARRLRVSRRSDLRRCVIAHGEAARPAPGMARLLAERADLRCLGAPPLDLAWLASGRLDGYWTDDCDPESLAAGIILVREAGGFLSRKDGSPLCLASTSLLAGNAHVHERLLRLVGEP